MYVLADNYNKSYVAGFAAWHLGGHVSFGSVSLGALELADQVSSMAFNFARIQFYAEEL